MKRYLLVTNTGIAINSAETAKEACNKAQTHYNFFKKEVKIYDTLKDRYLKCYTI